MLKDRALKQIIFIDLCPGFVGASFTQKCHASCSASPGPRMSASQLTYALSTWPELSEQERMARFMAALHVTRPGTAADPSSHETADMLSSVLSGSPAERQPLRDAPEQHVLYQGSPDSSLCASRQASSAGSRTGGTARLAASWSLCRLLRGIHTESIGSMASGEPCLIYALT